MLTACSFYWWRKQRAFSIQLTYDLSRCNSQRALALLISRLTWRQHMLEWSFNGYCKSHRKCWWHIYCKCVDGSILCIQSCVSFVVCECLQLLASLISDMVTAIIVGIIIVQWLHAPHLHPIKIIRVNNLQLLFTYQTIRLYFVLCVLCKFQLPAHWFAVFTVQYTIMLCLFIIGHYSKYYITTLTQTRLCSQDKYVLHVINSKLTC